MVNPTQQNTQNSKLYQKGTKNNPETFKKGVLK